MVVADPDGHLDGVNRPTPAHPAGRIGDAIEALTINEWGPSRWLRSEREKRRWVLGLVGPSILGVGTVRCTGRGFADRHLRSCF